MGSELDLAQRVGRLTAGQRACLDFVDDHATSKEIARQLGISRHTVDARLRAAIRTLGVASRREAAIIYRAANEAGAYQSFTYQPPQIVNHGGEADIPGTASMPQQTETATHDPDDFDQSYPAMPTRRPAGAIEAPPLFAADSAVWSPAALSVLQPRRTSLRLWGGANDLNPTQRLLGIMIVMILAMLAFGTFLSGIEALAQLRG